MSTQEKILNSILIYGSLLVLRVTAFRAFDWHIHGLSGWIVFVLVCACMATVSMLAKNGLMGLFPRLDSGKPRTFLAGLFFGLTMISTFGLMHAMAPELVSYQAPLTGAMLWLSLGLACSLGDCFGYGIGLATPARSR